MNTLFINLPFTIHISMDLIFQWNSYLNGIHISTEFIPQWNSYLNGFNIKFLPDLRRTALSLADRAFEGVWFSYEQLIAAAASELGNHTLDIQLCIPAGAALRYDIKIQFYGACHITGIITDNQVDGLYCRCSVLSGIFLRNFDYSPGDWVLMHFTTSSLTFS